MIATLILVATAITCPPHPQGAKASEVGISCPEQLALYEEMLNHENTFIRTQGWWHIEWLYEAWTRPVGRNQPKCPNTKFCNMDEWREVERLYLTYEHASKSAEAADSHARGSETHLAYLLSHKEAYEEYYENYWPPERRSLASGLRRLAESLAERGCPNSESCQTDAYFELLAYVEELEAAHTRTDDPAPACATGGPATGGGRGLCIGGT